MKISSKSILSPARAGSSRDPPSSLSTSLSRRLKNSGSIKGGASPAMFPATKKRGSFENPEPSSPKVTCIGQVRVKTKKKQAKKLRTLSRRHTTGDLSFRQQPHHHHQESWPPPPPPPPPQERNNPKWVHFPVTICDALRAFGSEFSCLFPCRKEEKPAAAADDVSNDNNRHGSCGAVFARWMVAVQDGGGEERDIELVVEKVEEEMEMEEEEEEGSFKKARRHVFEDLEIINGGIEGESRVSICIPPKNALLLMRCRSDPVKMEALTTTTRSWEPTIGRNDEEEDEEIVEVQEAIGGLKECEEDLKMRKKEIMGLDQGHENVQENEGFHGEEHENVQKDEVFQDQDHENEVIQDNVQEDEVFQDQDHDNVQKDEVFQDQDHDNVQKDEVFQECVQENEGFQDQDHENVQENEVFQDQDHEDVQQDEVFLDQEHYYEQQDEVYQDQDQENQQTEEESMYLGLLFEEIMNQDDKIQENESDSQMVEVHEEIKKVVSTTMPTELAEISKTHEEEMVTNGVLERESEVKQEREEALPDCLLMMMYEPKLSMEVSRETWVCSQDFIRRQSNKRKPPPPPAVAPAVVKHDGGDESRVSVGVSANANANSTTRKDNELMRVADGGHTAALPHPARSSCSFPVAPLSMAAMLEQKLANAMGYEPFVLTRCKSEPMKTAAAKLLPESCVWENRRSKRLSGVAFGGVGAAGLGF